MYTIWDVIEAVIALGIRQSIRLTSVNPGVLVGVDVDEAVRGVRIASIELERVIQIFENCPSDRRENSTITQVLNQ